MAEANVYSKSLPTLKELRLFTRALALAKISARTQALFLKLAELPPAMRLMMNLDSFIVCFAVQDIVSVPKDMLTSEEYSALTEVDRDLAESIHLREIAHGLLNIHERWLCLRSMRKSFTQARLEPMAFLRPLDSMLERADTTELVKQGPPNHG